MEPSLTEPPSFQSFPDSDPNNARRQATPLLKEDGVENADSGQGNNEDSLRTNRQSQVVRRVNSGFEILRPGTLTNPEVPAVLQILQVVTGSSSRSYKNVIEHNPDLKESRNLLNRSKPLS